MFLLFSVAHPFSSGMLTTKETGILVFGVALAIIVAVKGNSHLLSLLIIHSFGVLMLSCPS